MMLSVAAREETRPSVERRLWVTFSATLATSARPIRWLDLREWKTLRGKRAALHSGRWAPTRRQVDDEAQIDG